MNGYKDIFYLILEFYHNIQCDDDREDPLSCRGCSNNLLCSIYQLSFDKVWKGEY